MPPLVVIVGPTASGKTALGIDLAKRFNGEIICADSRTVYKGMDVSTAKPSIAEQKQVRHHLLDIVEPNQRFTAADFKQLANQAISDITQRGKAAFLVGGSGMYIDSVIFDYAFGQPDAERDPNNPRHRLIPHASDKKLRTNTLVVGIDTDREILRSRITDRVEIMVQIGLADEIGRLLQQYPHDLPAFDTPAFQAFRPYVLGETSIERAKELFIISDMQLAKKQMTWFKRNKYIHWLNDPSKSVDLVTTFLNTKG